MGAGPLCPGQMYSRHDLAKYGFGTGCRGTWTRNSDNSDEMAQSLLKKVGSLEGRAKSRFRPSQYATKATRAAEASKGPPTRLSTSSLSSSSSSSPPPCLSPAHEADPALHPSLGAAQAEARGERPSGDLREAPPHVSALASWRAKYKRRR